MSLTVLYYSIQQARKLQKSFADGYSALLVKTVAELRRFGGTESWRIACAVLLRNLAARPDAYVCVCLVSLRLWYLVSLRVCVFSPSPSVCI